MIIKAAIIYRLVKFYERISYTLLNSDGNFNSNLDLNIGAVVQIKEENGVSYAIIKAIFTHKYNDDLTYAFIWVDWLRESLTIDPNKSICQVIIILMSKYCFYNCI